MTRQDGFPDQNLYFHKTPTNSAGLLAVSGSGFWSNPEASLICWLTDEPAVDRWRPGFWSAYASCSSIWDWNLRSALRTLGCSRISWRSRRPRNPWIIVTVEAASMSTAAWGSRSSGTPRPCRPDIRSDPAVVTLGL